MSRSSKWLLDVKQNPKDPLYAVFFTASCHLCGNSYPAVCFWDGKAWDNKLSLEIDDASGAIGENETIYAWADVFSSDIPDVAYPDKSITIKLSDYHLTEAQLKAFLNDYKENFLYMPD